MYSSFTNTFIKYLHNLLFITLINITFSVHHLQPHPALSICIPPTSPNISFNQTSSPLISRTLTHYLFTIIQVRSNKGIPVLVCWEWYSWVVPFDMGWDLQKDCNLPAKKTNLSSHNSCKLLIFAAKSLSLSILGLLVIPLAGAHGNLLRSLAQHLPSSWLHGLFVDPSLTRTPINQVSIMSSNFESHYHYLFCHDCT